MSTQLIIILVLTLFFLGLLWHDQPAHESSKLNLKNHKPKE